MNARRITLSILSLLIVFTMIFGSAMAEDGKLFRRNISKTPPLETAKAGIFMMDFYVPAQAATGEAVVIDNYIAADDLGTVIYEPREYAKPLISVYIDGPSTHTIHDEESAGFSIDGGIIFGAMDAFVGVSLDDGTTTKTTNVSRSADLSSFTLANGHAYPGHVHQFVHQVFGDNIFAAWVSKYCEGGTPLYSLDLATYAAYFDDLELTYGKDAVYLYDLFGVNGAQDSVDYTAQGYPEVGEIPYSCVWSARGQLVPTLLTADATPGHESVWLDADATATPTRTPRPVTVTPTPIPLELAIRAPTAMPLPPAPVPQPEVAPEKWLPRYVCPPTVTARSRLFT